MMVTLAGGPFLAGGGGSAPPASPPPAAPPIIPAALPSRAPNSVYASYGELTSSLATDY